jgi:hypothetical protein
LNLTRPCSSRSKQNVWERDPTLCAHAIVERCSFVGEGGDQIIVAYTIQLIAAVVFEFFGAIHQRQSQITRCARLESGCLANCALNWRIRNYPMATACAEENQRKSVANWNIRIIVISSGVPERDTQVFCHLRILIHKRPVRWPAMNPLATMQKERLAGAQDNYGHA